MRNLIKNAIIISSLLMCFKTFAYTGICTGPGGLPNVSDTKLSDMNIGPNNNTVGTVIQRTFYNSSSVYLKCDCNGAENNYTWTFTSVGNLPPVGDGYFKLNEYLDVGLDIEAGGWHSVPFKNITTSTEAVNCPASGWNAPGYATGNHANLRIRISKPFVGVIELPGMSLFDLYTCHFKNGVTGSDCGPHLGKPNFSYTLTGKIVAPEECVVNAGQVIEINVGNVAANRFTTNGAPPEDYTPINKDVSVKCKNIQTTKTIALKLKGVNDANNPSLLSSSNPDVGIQIKDKSDGGVITPNEGGAKVSLNYTTQEGTASLTVSPINTTGKTPSVGAFSSTGTLEVQFN